MINPQLPKFQTGQALTASSLNKVVAMLNDHERRLMSQAITAGKGYTFTQSQGGTSLNITAGGSAGDDGSSYEAPFAVRYIGKSTEPDYDDWTGNNTYDFHINTGTIFGLDGSCASYQKIDAETCPLLLDPTDNNASTWLICALIRATPMAVIGDWTLAFPDVQDNPDDQQQHDAYIMARAARDAMVNIMNVVGTPLARSIPFKGEFVSFVARDLDVWNRNRAYDVGQESFGDDPTDIYEMNAEWNVYFPIALVEMTENANPKITQILHSDIYWYAHWTNDIHVDGSGKTS